jgi:CTP synthase
MVVEKLGLKMTDNRPQLDAWREMADHVDSLENDVTIAMVGKYTGLTDSYLSVIKALQHSAFKVGAKMNISWVDATGLEPESESKDPELYAKSWHELKAADGVLVPGGFGNRGIEGMILAAQYARENQVPYLGVCLGLQVAVIEFTRNVLGKTGANSTEFDEDTPHPAVIFMPEGSRTHMGGTMRLGSRQTNIQTEDCAALRLYDGATEIHERHRHRYEVNPDMISDLEKAGLNFVGKDTEAQRMEIIELTGHPFFFGTQYHPEFKSRPNRPSPPFFGLVEAAFSTQS